MPIFVACNCGGKFNAPDHLAGQTVACPNCQMPLTVPAPAAQVEDVDIFSLQEEAAPGWTPPQQTFNHSSAGYGAGQAADDPLGLPAGRDLPSNPAYAQADYGEICPKCKRDRGPVSEHTYHWVYTFLVLTVWNSKTVYCCERCGNWLKTQAILGNMAFGWWGPYGLIITPLQIYRNINEL